MATHLARWASLVLAVSTTFATSAAAIAATPPDAAAFLKSKQQKTKDAIAAEEAQVKELKRDKTLSASERAKQIKAAQQRIARLRSRKPSIPVLKVAREPIKEGQAGTISDSGTVKKVLSDTSALVLFHHFSKGVVLDANNYIKPESHSQTVIVEGISNRSVTSSKLDLKVGAELEFTRIMEVVKNDDGKLVLRPWTAPDAKD